MEEVVRGVVRALKCLWQVLKVPLGCWYLGGSGRGGREGVWGLVWGDFGEGEWETRGRKERNGQ